MRTTPVLNAVHIGRLIKQRWHQRGKLKFENAQIQRILAQNKVKFDTVEAIDKIVVEKVRTNLLVPEDPPLDENHPDWKAEPCYIYNDNDTLLEGLDQARLLTNTLEISQLPPSLLNAEKNLELPDEIHEEAKKRIMLSCIFDAYQERLPKRLHPTKPAFNLPRDYGITDARKIKLLLNNLVQICDLHSGSFDKSVMSDGFFTVPLRIPDELLLLELSADLVLRAKKGLPPILDSYDLEKKPLPDLHPLNSKVSLKKYHFYTERDFSSIGRTKFPHIHTLFLSFNKTTVKNFYDMEVTESQILGRNLMKMFCAAASEARVLYGKEVAELINPVVVQGVMTDGQYFHFSVFQLNNLNGSMNTNGEKNIYWNSPLIPLYDRCDYCKAIPTLEGYNPEVLRRIMAFYNNE